MVQDGARGNSNLLLHHRADHGLVPMASFTAAQLLDRARAGVDDRLGEQSVDRPAGAARGAHRRATAAAAVAASLDRLEILAAQSWVRVRPGPNGERGRDTAA